MKNLFELFVSFGRVVFGSLYVAWILMNTLVAAITIVVMFPYMRLKQDKACLAQIWCTAEMAILLPLKVLKLYDQAMDIQIGDYTIGEVIEQLREKGGLD